VAYRASLQAEARRLGLAGWVRNSSDGAVEFEVQGAPDAVASLMDWATRGPRFARVESLETSPVEGGETYRAFEVRP